MDHWKVTKKDEIGMRKNALINDSISYSRCRIELKSEINGHVSSKSIC